MSNVLTAHYEGPNFVPGLRARFWHADGPGNETTKSKWRIPVGMVIVYVVFCSMKKQQRNN